MKRITQILILVSLFLFSDCRREKSWVIKGRLLESCDNPVPVAGHKLHVSSSYSISNPRIETDHLGNFSLPYELDYRQFENIEVQGENDEYVIGIPKKQNVNVGDVYLRDNYFFEVQLSVKSITSNKDTIYYNQSGFNHMLNRPNYLEYIVGPFEDGQIIDTFVRHNYKLYDSVYLYRERHKAFFYFSASLNERKLQFEFEDVIPECKRYNKLVLFLD